jgi:hypothetical protein
MEQRQSDSGNAVGWGELHVHAHGVRHHNWTECMAATADRVRLRTHGLLVASCMKAVDGGYFEWWCKLQLRSRSCAAIGCHMGVHCGMCARW